MFKRSLLLTSLGATSVAVGLLFGAAEAAEQKFVEFKGEKFPALAAMVPPPIPMDNPQTVGKDGFPLMDDPKVQLGYHLIFDTRLTQDASLSCMTCHDPKEGTSLSSGISRGYPGTSHWRHSQPLVNTGHLGKLFWQTQSLSLEAQAPDANLGFSGNGKADMLEERLRQAPEYVQKFKAVFGTEWPTLEDAWRAIAAYERALNDYNTPFDRYMRGEKTALTPKQIKGMEIFQGKAGCIQCHNGYLLSDEKFYNTGVPDAPEFQKDPIVQSAHRWQNYSKGLSEDVFRKAKSDLGVYFSTKWKPHMYAMRTPPLRYLIYTAPYMHTGTIDTLEDVVEFYNKGGGDDHAIRDFGFSTKTKRLKPLNLTKDEKEALVAFLESTSGQEIKIAQPKLPNDEPFPKAVAKFLKGEEFPSEAERFLRVRK